MGTLVRDNSWNGYLCQLIGDMEPYKGVTPRVHNCSIYIAALVSALIRNHVLPRAKHAVTGELRQVLVINNIYHNV